MEHIWIQPVQSLEMNVYQYGMEECTGGHSFGPAVRDHFLLHFIEKGRGIFRTEDREYPLSAGMGFLISPDKMTAYRADASEPWTYMWIGFNGGNAASLLGELSLSPETPVFRFNEREEVKRIFEHAIAIRSSGVHAQLSLTSVLFSVLSKIGDKPPEGKERRSHLFYSGKEYARSAAQYMEQSYASSISITGIAARLGLHRTYFSALFKKHYRMSPQEYLMKIRMSRAADFLLSRDMSVSDVARTVGYEDPLLFSRLFKKNYGVSPRLYREQKEKAHPLS